MIFRNVVSDDFAALMGLYRQLQPLDPILENGQDRAVFEQIIDSTLLQLFVLEDDDTSLVASCYLNIIPNITRSASPYAIIENVITEQTRRQSGYGRQIIQQTLNYAWSHGCYKAMLQTGSKQAGTHAFYRACGFSADDKTGYVARPATALTQPAD
jgi:GNAT superfamily N-acetyltransferase